MPTQDTAVFDLLVKLIFEVKPGLAGSEVRPEDSLVDGLGLDSLDILQLSRKVNRDLGFFDLDEWGESADSHGRTVNSILDALEPA